MTRGVQLCSLHLDSTLGGPTDPPAVGTDCRSRPLGSIVVTITLRALNDGDLGDLFRWESDPAAASMAAFTRPDPTDRAAFDAHYQHVRSNPENTTRAIDEDGALVGMIASFTMAGDREVTYWVDPSRWGRGIASEALRLCILGEPRKPLYARAAEHNIGSRRVLERNGFVKIGEETSWADGPAADVVEHVYRLD
ncbi:GNAT family N-acetyltransferase [Solicola gregarius]|uniref:GNAT family N-acetyltransferase n=1 Tax=Solicola gregarius TaxID=2908642 RepID=A0AA46TLU5_9ACTN|nr:GNAT family N-acetyltransferase [Solicola gregarius]UYM07309.1 GNAT family N-acetyltransferase [Solicola gregarius]